MNVVQLSVKGSNPWNEDGLIIHEELQIYGVVDGATSLVPFTGPRGETGGYYASRIIVNALDRILCIPGQDEVPLAQALLEANRELRAEMLRHNINVERKEELWGACAVVIRLSETGVEYVQTGDCMLAAIYRDGTIRVVTRDQVAHLDQETYRLWAEGVAEGIKSREQLWHLVKPQIVSGRQSANTPSGYAVLNGEPEVADHLEYGRINRINLKALLLMTDGLYVPKRAFETPFDPVEATSLVMKMGLREYVDWVIQTEENDPDCLEYPRVKKSDDKSAVWIEL
jgi:serine/threonine protein phosphatase PrpC